MPESPTVRARAAQLLARLDELTEDEWALVAAQESEAEATFGPTRDGEIEAMLRTSGQFERLTSYLVLAHPILDRWTGSQALDRFSLAASGVTGIFIVADKDVPWAWRHRLLAALVPTVIPSEWLDETGVPFSRPPALPEFRLRFRMAALTGPEWEAAVRTGQYAAEACGAAPISASAEKAASWLVSQPDNPLTRRRLDAAGRFDDIFVGNPFSAAREIRNLVGKRIGLTAQETESPYATGKTEVQTWAEMIATDAFLAVCALAGLSTEEFSQLYLPLVGTIPFLSLFPRSSV